MGLAPKGHRMPLCLLLLHQRRRFVEPHRLRPCRDLQASSLPLVSLTSLHCVVEVSHRRACRHHQRRHLRTVRDELPRLRNRLLRRPHRALAATRFSTSVPRRIAAIAHRLRAFALCSVARCGIRLEWHRAAGRILGLFDGKSVCTSRMSPPGPLLISYGHVGCLKARAFSHSRGCGGGWDVFPRTRC